MSLVLRYTPETWSTFSEMESLEASWSFAEDRTREALLEAEARIETRFASKAQEEMDGLQYELEECRQFYNGEISQFLRYSAIAMLAAQAEKHLKSAVRNLESKRGKAPISTSELKPQSTVERTRIWLAAFHGIELERMKNYDRLLSIQKLRNHLIHGFGMEKKDSEIVKLQSFANGCDGILCDPHGNITIERVYVEESIKAVWGFFTALYCALSWQIEKRWLDHHNVKAATHG